METVEELKTYVGIMMGDLRCNWAYSYMDRMQKVEEKLFAIRYNSDATDSDKEDATEDSVIIENEMDGCEFDGRVFRDANFYDYCSKEGLTEEVERELKKTMSCLDILEDYREEIKG